MLAPLGVNPAGTTAEEVFQMLWILHRHQCYTETKSSSSLPGIEVIFFGNILAPLPEHDLTPLAVRKTTGFQ